MELRYAICEAIKQVSINFKGLKLYIIQGIFSEHSRIKMEINNKKISGKDLNLWKLLLDNPEVKQKITGLI